MRTKNVTYRLDEPTRALIESLGEAFGLTKTDIVRRAVATLRDLIGAAAGDAADLLTEIRARYTNDAEIAIWTTSADGEPVAHVLINGEKPIDVSAHAIALGDRALIFLELAGSDVNVPVPLGNKTLRVRPRRAVADLPWPPQPLRIVTRLADLGTGALGP